MKLWLSIGLVVCFGVCWGQPEFNRNYLADDGNVGWSIIQTDTGYSLCGGGFSAQYSMWIATKIFHLDSFGHTSSKKELGKVGYAYFPGKSSSFIKLSGDGYSYAGSIVDSSRTNSYASITRFDEAGDTLWTRAFGSLGYNCFNMERQTHNGGLIAAGWLSASYISPSRAFVVKVDSQGNQEWLKTFGVSGVAETNSVEPTADGGYIIAGGDGVAGENLTQPFMVKTDSNGAVKWFKHIANPMNNCSSKAIQSRFGGYYSWGWMDTLDNPFKMYVYRLDSNGVVEWRHFFDNPVNPYLGQLRELADGSLVGVGGKDIRSANSGAGWVVKLDSMGQELWERLYASISDSGQFAEASFRDLQPTRDGGFVITGTRNTDTLGTYYQNFWLVKTDSMGCINGDCGYKDTISGINEITTEQPTLHINPNPAQNILTITWASTNPNAVATISLYDLLGREVYQSKPAANVSAEVDVSSLQQGMYIVKVRVRDSVMTGKVMKE